MALDKNKLEQALKNLFDRAKAENWETGQLAAAFASAIDDFVRAGEVKDVTTKVQVDPNTGVGQGAQTGAARVQ